MKKIIEIISFFVLCILLLSCSNMQYKQKGSRIENEVIGEDVEAQILHFTKQYMNYVIEVGNNNDALYSNVNDLNGYQTGLVDLDLYLRAKKTIELNHKDSEYSKKRNLLVESKFNKYLKSKKIDELLNWVVEDSVKNVILLKDSDLSSYNGIKIPLLIKDASEEFNYSYEDYANIIFKEFMYNEIRYDLLFNYYSKYIYSEAAPIWRADAGKDYVVDFIIMWESYEEWLGE